REELRVDSGDVISLDEIVRIDLPIGIEGQALLAYRLVGLDRFIRQLPDQVAELSLEVAIRSDGRENQAAPFAHTDGFQLPLLLPKGRILAEPGSVDQPAFLVVSPVVVGAADRPATARSFHQEPRAAVAADIAKSPQHPIAASEDEDLEAGDGGRQIGAVLA